MYWTQKDETDINLLMWLWIRQYTHFTVLFYFFLFLSFVGKMLRCTHSQSLQSTVGLHNVREWFWGKIDGAIYPTTANCTFSCRSCSVQCTVIQIEFVTTELHLPAPLPQNIVYISKLQECSVSKAPECKWFTQESSYCVISGQYGAACISCVTGTTGKPVVNHQSGKATLNGALG